MSNGDGLPLLKRKPREETKMKDYSAPILIGVWKEPDENIVYTYGRDPYNNILVGSYTRLSKVSDSELAKLLKANAIIQLPEDSGMNISCDGPCYKVVDPKLYYETLKEEDLS